MDNDALGGSYKVGEPEQFDDDDDDIKPTKISLKDRIIEYVRCTEKPTKAGIFLNVSSSGTCQVLITGLITNEIFVEKYFDCHSCTYFELNESKFK